MRLRLATLDNKSTRRRRRRRVHLHLPAERHEQGGERAAQRPAAAQLRVGRELRVPATRRQRDRNGQAVAAEELHVQSDARHDVHVAAGAGGRLGHALQRARQPERRSTRQGARLVPATAARHTPAAAARRTTTAGDQSKAVQEEHLVDHWQRVGQLLLDVSKRRQWQANAGQPRRDHQRREQRLHARLRRRLRAHRAAPTTAAEEDARRHVLVHTLLLAADLRQGQQQQQQQQHSIHHDLSTRHQRNNNNSRQNSSVPTAAAAAASIATGLLPVAARVVARAAATAQHLAADQLQGRRVWHHSAHALHCQPLQGSQRCQPDDTA